MSGTDSSWKIDGKTTVPGFVFRKFDDGSCELQRLNTIEWDIPDDTFLGLDIVPAYPEIALITSLDGRIKKDAYPDYKCRKFLYYSFSKGDNTPIITTYQIYLRDGPVLVYPWDDEKKGLLGRIDMYHVNMGGDKTPNKVLVKHLERIMGKQLLTDGLRELAEKTYFDILWNVPSF